MDKLPCDWRTGQLPPRGQGGPGIWTDYASALANAPLADQGHGHGVGFSLSGADPFWFLDIDNCVVDGDWSPLAKQLMARLAGVAIEVSQSGRGLHLIGQGVVPEHRCKNIPLGLELYTEQRFIALTGTHASGSADHVVDMTQIVEEFFQPLASTNDALPDWTSEPIDAWAGPDDDAELICRMLAARSTPAALGRGVSFKALWERDVDKLAERWPPDSPSKDFDYSAADAALFAHLAWWTGHNCERIERLARESALYRDKYDRADYMQSSIMRAAAQVKGCYHDPKSVPAIVPEVVHGATYSLSNSDLGDKSNHLTIEMWIGTREQAVWYDEFRDVVMYGAEQLTDHIQRKIWFDIRAESNLRIAKDMFDDVLRKVAYDRRRHPLREWLDTQQSAWDGTQRLDSWMTRYLGVTMSHYSAAVGALFLTAAVRRIRQPGAKFDEMIVLEGPQGAEKSSAIAALCDDPDWFCDSLHLRMDPKELLEMTRGKWIVEAPELSRMSDSETEHIKAMLSRRSDRARMAYERNVTDRARQWVGFGTTNSNKYLRDPTGNRRIWPVLVTQVDVAGLSRDRAQLWAEAAHREASGASIRLPRTLWDAAAAEQADRVVDDPLLDHLRDLFGDKTGRVRGLDVVRMLGIPIDRQAKVIRQLGDAMRNLGWENKMVSVNSEKIRYYVKGDASREITLVSGALIYAPPDLRAVQ
jgi:hypothetical protein